MRVATLVLLLCLCLLSGAAILLIKSNRDIDVRLHFYFGPQRAISADTQ